MLNYNKYYDNKKYNRLAELVAKAMGENKESTLMSYLNLMVKIQTKAMWLCDDICEIQNDMIYTQSEFEMLVYDDDAIWEAYNDFLMPFSGANIES